MAEGIFRQICVGKYEVYSAGTHPSSVRTEAIEALREIGIDISGNRSKSVDEFAGAKIDFVLTVCDDAHENCPYFPAMTRLFHRAFPDPAKVSGEYEVRLEAFRRIRDEIAEYLKREFLPLIESFPQE